MTRACGSCTQCCKSLAIKDPELDKPAHQWCSNCAKGKGCVIYPTRPMSCKVFSCLWLMNETVDLELRPDQIGVVLQPRPDGGLSAVCGPDRPVAWRHPRLLRILKRLASLGYQVNVVSGKRHWVITPTAEWEAPPENIIDLGEGMSTVRIPAQVAKDIGMYVRNDISLLSQVGPT